MEAQSRVLAFSVLAILFVSLLAWYANDLFEATAIPESDWSWSDSQLDRSDFEWFANFWDVVPLVADEEPIRFRFWKLPSFETEYLVDISLLSENIASANVKMRNKEGLLGDPNLNERLATAEISNSDLNSLMGLLDETRFWAVPPGELRWHCSSATDGVAFVVETNIGGQYRLWSNACTPSKEMLQLADYFERLVRKIAWPSDV